MNAFPSNIGVNWKKAHAHTIWAYRGKITASPRTMENFTAALSHINDILFPTSKYPFYFLTPHAQQNINGQHQMPETQLPEHPVVFLHPKAAAAKGLTENSPAVLWNETAEIAVTVCLTETVPEDIILCPHGESRSSSLNRLTVSQSTDMGEVRTGAPGVALYDVTVDIRPQLERETPSFYQ